ncbi:MAG: response regulator [Candidatus Omnitrophica bacterium]|nr:response regulator [Candidatus Omnitrophota bacterium]HPB68618.1 ATP-binding protein [Candidatus Omnitrophota bacterium]
MNKLLARQLKKYMGPGYKIPSEWAGFIKAVEDAYEGFEADRKLTERAFELSSQEISEINSRLRAEIEERKRVEKVITVEKERLSVTLRSIGDGVITIDRHQRVTLINNVAENLTGWPQEDAVGKTFDEIFVLLDPKTRQRKTGLMNSVLSHGGLVEISLGLLSSRDGKEFFITDSIAAIRDFDSNIIGAVLVFRDITEKRKMEDEIFKKRKLESLGTLAGGIAHDFNNILTAVLGNLTLLKMALVSPDEIHTLLGEIETQALRAQGLTEQLLTFSKGGTPVKKLASVGELIRESATFVLHGSNVLATFVLPDDLWSVEVDKGQFNQVIQNIVLNAKQAMPQGGLLTIEAKNLIIDRREALPLEKGQYIRISFADTGEGIPEELLSKIFDPYFTTKESGNGLGLATVFSIIERHDGYITVDSSVGKGTIFYLYIPAAGFSPPEPSQAEVLLYTHSGRILLMDDEESLRAVLGRILKNIGYEVELVCNGEEALRRYQEARNQKADFDVVILDLTIRGGMGGKDTLQTLLKLDPQVKAVAFSGYSNDPVMARYQEYGFKGVLVKPFKYDELCALLKSLIKK